MKEIRPRIGGEKKENHDIILAVLVITWGILYTQE